MANNIVSGERELANQVMGIAAYLPAAAAKVVVKSITLNTPEITKAIYRGIGKNAIPANRMKSANLRLAKGAQLAIATGWKARLPVKAPGYRRGGNPDKDRLSGALGQALASEQMTAGTTDKAISFLNTRVLWEQARHWHRVNYGAFGPIATPKNTQAFPVNVDGHTIVTLRDPGRPDPNSWLPRKRYSKGPEFFAPARINGPDGPKENKADVPGGGHRSALFTDLGFKHVAKHAEGAYASMLHRWIKDEGAEAVRHHLHMRGVRIKVGRLGISD